MAEVVSGGGGGGGDGGERKVMVAIDDCEYSYYALMWVPDNLNDQSLNSHLSSSCLSQPPCTITRFRLIKVLLDCTAPYQPVRSVVRMPHQLHYANMGS